MGFSRNASEDKYEFKVIVLRHLSKILELSCHELRDQTKQLLQPNHVTLIEQEDTRISYLQSVEGLASILYPYFDKQMMDAYKEFDLLYDLFLSEFKEKYKEECEKITGDKIHSYFLYTKLKQARKVFRELNLLLKRIDYLNVAIFGESEDNDVVDGDSFEEVS